MVPPRREDRAVVFELEAQDVRVAGDPELAMAIAGRCTARRTVARIADEVGDSSGAVAELVRELLERGVVVDSRRAWTAFHRLSSNRPMPAQATMRARTEPPLRAGPRAPATGRREKLRADRSSLLEVASERWSGTSRDRSGTVAFEDLSTLLAAMYSLGRNGHMTVPSAGGFYPLSVDVLIRDGPSPLEPGLWWHDPVDLELALVRPGELKVEDALLPHPVTDPMVRRREPIVFISADLDRPSVKYSNRAYRFALNEVGAAMQNAYLLAAERNLAVRAVGGYYDQRTRELLALGDDTVPLLAVLVCA